MRRSQKQEVVAELQAAVDEHPHLVVTGYRGLSVKEMTELRRALKNHGAHLKVVKKTLFLRALGQGARAGLADHLDGPVAVTFVSGDAANVLKEISTFARTHEQLGFQGGWVDGNLFDGRQLAELAALPARNELLGRLVGVLSAPLSQLVGTLQAVPRDLVLTLQAIAGQRQEAGAASVA